MNTKVNTTNPSVIANNHAVPHFRQKLRLSVYSSAMYLGRRYSQDCPHSMHSWYPGFRQTFDLKRQRTISITLSSKFHCMFYLYYFFWAAFIVMRLINIDLLKVIFVYDTEDIDIIKIISILQKVAFQCLDL